MKQRFSYGNQIKKFIVILIAILYIVIAVSLPAMNRNGQVLIGGTVSVSGILSAFQFGLAFIMVAIEYDLGGTLAIILMAGSIFTTALTIVLFNNYSAAPGLCFYCSGLVALFFIRDRIYKERKNSLIDSLTGVSNRRHIIQYMNYLILNKRSFYAIYIDINNFKIINDAKGHSFGDKMLKEVVKKWCEIDKKNTAIGRIAGDEFLFVVQESKCKDVDALARKYMDAVLEWVEDNEVATLVVSASAGMACFPDDGKTSEDILRKSDMAMSHARNSGRNMFYRYEAAFEEIILREQYIEGRVRDALDNDGFYMVYQPQYNTVTKELRGFESLIRMNQKGERYLSPADFIPVAEKSDMIVEIGEFVLKRTMSDFAALFAAKPGYILSVNISAKQLLSKDFLGFIEKTIYDTSFNPANLEIEITEYCLMESTDIAVQMINDLKQLGVKIAMDDFGTGYSSLSYLTSLPIDLIKMDKTIIDTMTHGEIVKAIVSMGHALGCEIIAEGVEEENQLEILRNQECDFIQGFIWGKPMPLSEAVELL